GLGPDDLDGCVGAHTGELPGEGFALPLRVQRGADLLLDLRIRAVARGQDRVEVDPVNAQGARERWDERSRRGCSHGAGPCGVPARGRARAVVRFDGARVEVEPSAFELEAHTVL